MNLSNLTAADLNRAARIQERIEKLNAKLSRILGDTAPTVAETPKARRKMSASARAKIAAAQKARWAKQKGAESKPAAKKVTRKFSAAGLARIKAAQKARWAKVKAAKQG